MDFALQLAFWICLGLVFYTYLGYGLVLYLLLKVRNIFTKRTVVKDLEDESLPEITFIVAAYNEEDYIEDKIINNLGFDYPKEKIHFLFVTDGSNDRTPEIIKGFNYPEGVNWSLYHSPERRGKIAAVERIMEFVRTPITIYTDANTDVNPKAIRKIVRHYEDPTIGAVAGEKRIAMATKDAANAAGEGFYWKYESLLKKWDAQLYSVVGAAGELFSIRTHLYTPVPPDTIIEDFFLTLTISRKGYRVMYEPEAYAVENSSASVPEELKRKIRIAAGGLQAIYRLSPLLNVFKYGLLSFQYISHRVLRWTLTPAALPILLIINTILAAKGYPFFKVMLVLQVLFYLAAIIGYLLERQRIKFKAFFIPYYFCVMNYAVYRGFLRIIKGNQSVMWEKAKRA
jgi:cellulose synthase/poly-beta-1,6-N-acetylglucosamine synthase-like glycosyltransferase